MRACVFICLLLAGSTVSAASSRVVPAFEVHATVDKKDALLNFDRGAAAAVFGQEELNGIIGVTSDFPVGTVPSYIVFNTSVSESKLTELVNFQGRLKGTLVCQRVRLGSTPLFPQLKMAVLAEGCAIKSINH